MLARLWVCRLAPSWYFWHSAIRLRVSLLFELFQIILTIKWQLWNSTDWKKRRECTDTHVSSHSFVKGFTVKQHRLEKQRTHRHPCVIAILGKDLLWNRAGWISRERTDTRCVIAILWKGFNVEQHRLEKQRTHRHSCVITILWKGFTVEQSRLDK